LTLYISILELNKYISPS